MEKALTTFGKQPLRKAIDPVEAAGD